MQYTPNALDISQGDNRRVDKLLSGPNFIGSLEPELSRRGVQYPYLYQFKKSSCLPVYCGRKPKVS